MVMMRMMTAAGEACRSVSCYASDLSEAAISKCVLTTLYKCVTKKWDLKNKTVLIRLIFLVVDIIRR